ncbi:MAG TPA: hypothetical protein VH853_04350 [Polyangia bacterium]|nr:hypothetical protein [Polyangia bacterium]
MSRTVFQSVVPPGPTFKTTRPRIAVGLDVGDTDDPLFVSADDEVIVAVDSHPQDLIVRGRPQLQIAPPRGLAARSGRAADATGGRAARAGLSSGAAAPEAGIPRFYSRVFACGRAAPPGAPPAPSAGPSAAS